MRYTPCRATMPQSALPYTPRRILRAASALPASASQSGPFTRLRRVLPRRRLPCSLHIIFLFYLIFSCIASLPRRLSLPFVKKVRLHQKIDRFTQKITAPQPSFSLYWRGFAQFPHLFPPSLCQRIFCRKSSRFHPRLPPASASIPCILSCILRSIRRAVQNRPALLCRAGRRSYHCLYGTCQMVSAYWAMALSAAKLPLRAMFRRLIWFHCFLSP